MAWARVSRCLKCCLPAEERGSVRNPNNTETQTGPWKAAGLQRILVLLVGEPFEEIFTQPGLGTSQPLMVGQMVAQLLEEFHFIL